MTTLTNIISLKLPDPAVDIFPLRMWRHIVRTAEGRWYVGDLCVYAVARPESPACWSSIEASLNSTPDLWEAVHPELLEALLEDTLSLARA